MKLKEFKGTFPNMDAVVATYPSGGIEGDFVLVDGEVKGWNQYSNQWEQPTAEPAPSSRNTETIYGDLNVHHNVSIGGTLSAPLIRGKNAFCGVFDTEDSLRRHRPNPVPGEWAMVFAYTTPPPTPTSETEETVETVEQNSEQVEQSNEESVSAEPAAETTETPIKRDVRDITIGFIFIENDGQWVNSGYKGGYDGTFDALQQEVQDRKTADNALGGAIDDINDLIPEEADKDINKLADKKFVTDADTELDERIGDIEDLIPETADKDESPLADKHYVDTEVRKINAKIPSGTDSADNKLVNQNGLTQAINNLNAEKEQVAGEDGLSLNITEVHGKVTSIGGSIAMDSEPQQDSNKAVKSGGVATKIKEINDKIPAGTNNSGNKLVNQTGLQTGINNEALARQQADTNLEYRIRSYNCNFSSGETALSIIIPNYTISSTSIAGGNPLYIKFGSTVDTEGTTLNIQQTGAKSLYYNGSPISETNKIKANEIVLLYYDSGLDVYQAWGSVQGLLNLQANIEAEETRALDEERRLSGLITAEETRALEIEGGLRTDVNGINDKIPAGTNSTDNKLVNEDFVNDSINTATADFKGTYTSVENLIAGADNPNNNDYGYVESTTEEGNTILTRYKYDGTDWRYEYRLNNSGFTAAEWATIRSGATVDDVLKLRALPTNAQLNTTLAGKAAKVPNAVPGHVAVFDSTGSPVDSGTDLSVVYTDGAFDVSAYNNNAKFASLEALLNDERLSTLIPTDVRKGGMTLKFVCSSDNKYKQWRLKKNEWSIIPYDWEPFVSIDDVNKLKCSVDGVNDSYEFSLVASTGKSISLNSNMFAGKKYVYKMTTANDIAIYVRYTYADGTMEGANKYTNEDITIIPEKDIIELRFTPASSTDVVLTIKADSKFDDLNAELIGKISGTDKIARLYPFTTSIDKTLVRPGYDTQIVYSKDLCGIQFLQIETYSSDAFYFNTLYSYGNQSSVLLIRNASGSISFSYSAQRSSSSDRPVETLNLTAIDGESTLKAVIDWSKINKATGIDLDETFTIDESCICRKQRVFDITPYLDKTYNVDNKAADAKTLGGIARLYPFTCKLNTVLTRPSYDTQIVYSPQTAGILYLHIETSSKLDFYVETLYAYGGDHKAHLNIYNSNNQQVFAYSSDVRQSSSSSSFPTETIEVTASDGSTLKAIIDWSKINRAVGLDLNSSFTIDESCIHRVPEEEDLSLLCKFIPVTDYYVTGLQQRIYMNELAEYNPNGFFMFQATGNTGQEVISGWNGECQYLQFNVTSTKDITVTIKYYYQYEEIATKTITVHAVVGATLPVKKYMFIGDSLTYAGVYEKKFYDMNPDKVVLYGTIGTAPYLCEGRYGWGASDYINQASKGGLTNPFYNPTSQTFDFSYYMTNNPSFADVDCVVIFLGRNDGYSSGSLITNINTMLTSIKAFNSSIKTYVIGAYNVACNDSGTGMYLQSHAAMNHIGFNYNRNRFFATFTPETETKPIPVHLNLDNKYDYSSTTQDVSVVDNRQMEVYTDNVHPSNIGYEKFGMVINGFFHYEFRT